MLKIAINNPATFAVCLIFTKYNFHFRFRALEFKYEQSKHTTKIYEVAKTTKGEVKGVKRLTIWGDLYFSFERIPYAKPPLDELRFRAPVPAESWQGVLDGTGPAEKPLQTNVIFRKYKGSEDCLYLNVFTKSVSISFISVAATYSKNFFIPYIVLSPNII